MARELPPAVREALVGLGRLGARALAAAVDTALEEGQELVAEVNDRLKRGRREAQRIGRKPRKKVHVEVKPPTSTGDAEEMVGEVVDDKE